MNSRCFIVVTLFQFLPVLSKILIITCIIHAIPIVRPYYSMAWYKVILPFEKQNKNNEETDIALVQAIYNTKA